MPRIPSPRRVADNVNQRRTRTVEDSRMPLTEHLRELRNRVAKALIAFVLATIVCFFFEQHILNFLMHPYCSLPAHKRASFQGQTCQLYVFGILDPFMIRLKISAIAGAIASSPVWLYQLWSFITPGLHRHERRWSLTFVALSLGLFAVGACFAYITLRTGLNLLLGFSGDGIVSVLDANKYLSYVIAMVLIFGASFEIPLLVCLLNLAGVVPTAKLRAWRRSEIFLTFLFAAIVTPSQDPFTMLALGLPMIILYEVALFVGWLNDRRKKNRGDSSAYSDLADDEASPLDFDDSGETARRAALAARAQQDDRAGRKARAQLAAMAQAQSGDDAGGTGGSSADIT
ncbi:twin-arginine translocase subunit TatC [Pseudofrankia inefficax]|uniref:Sec-independent protein translocase protein TatC n=1 Tax=Pseudofrankia inefficax (strain DSM 45817 / CECT 9037 / DDB 130130 / EuI1c) TaxID=298654 RepID=E3J2T7_PSEI1|nr:twin-arginine translocase subunit TatC [Pseudofrankia inefficax]ADP81748.1 Sec-independent protein translocase, TatC subunit [Pseudofrankia inefficax]